jgi:hypothetical protein
MGAVVVPVFLVPALAAVLVLGLDAEARQRSRRRAPGVAREPASMPTTRRESTGPA